MQSLVPTCIAFISLAIFTNPLAADVVSQDLAQGVAPGITSITSCSNDSGHYRVVVFSQGFEHVSSSAYLQWLEWNQDGPRLLHSTLIEEVSSGLWSSEAPEVISTETCSMQLRASHTYSSEMLRLVLRPSDVGTYSVERDEQK
ncbi:hypothetical protein [Pseudomonas sp. Marseille-Q8238]